MKLTLKIAAKMYTGLSFLALKAGENFFELNGGLNVNITEAFNLKSQNLNLFLIFARAHNTKVGTKQHPQSAHPILVLFLFTQLN